MADVSSLTAEPRAVGTKGALRSLRVGGRVPGVVYGEGEEQVLISLETRVLKRALNNPRFASTLFDLELDGQAIRVLPREVQRHMITEDPIHIDFQRIGRGAAVTVTIPVVFANEEGSPGLKRGGVLNVVRREVELVCPADAIPAEIRIDLAGFDIHDSVHISDARLPAGVEPSITDRDFTIATISAPSGVESEEEQAEEAAEEES
jgi:large subunit ribosomal protein L25